MIAPIVVVYYIGTAVFLVKIPGISTVIKILMAVVPIF